MDPRLRTEGKLKTYQRVLLVSLGNKYVGNFLLIKQYGEFESQAMVIKAFVKNLKTSLSAQIIPESDAEPYLFTKALPSLPQ